MRQVCGNFRSNSEKKELEAKQRGAVTADSLTKASSAVPSAGSETQTQMLELKKRNDELEDEVSLLCYSSLDRPCCAFCMCSENLWTWVTYSLHLHHNGHCKRLANLTSVMLGPLVWSTLPTTLHELTCRAPVHSNVIWKPFCSLAPMDLSCIVLLFIFYFF